MSALKFDFEWIDPGAAKGGELRATWARLHVSVNDQPVTRLVDQTSRSVRNGVFLPLYPVAEWFVTRWWFLLHEVQSRRSIDRLEYRDRHSLRSAAEGFALPDLAFSPNGHSMQVQWQPIQLEHQRVEFTERGQATIDIEEFRQSVLDLVIAVAKRLNEFEIRDTLLQQEMEAIAKIEPDEAEFCAAAAALGVDPYAAPSEQADAILSVASELPPSVTSEFFSAAEVLHLREDANQLLKGIKASRANPADLDRLKTLKREFHFRIPDATPWAQGYDVARELRGHLRINGLKVDSIAGLSEAFGVSSGELEKATRFVLSDRTALEVVTDVNDKNSPGFALAERRQPAVLFALCRAIFEYLVTPDRQPLIVTRARTERQKRNRAFAAEFLVPASALREVLPDRDLSYEDVDDLAERFGVSAAVIRHQIENHGLATLEA